MAVASKTIAMFEVALSALDRELRSDQVGGPWSISARIGADLTM